MELTMASEQRNRIHPYKFILLIAMGSIVMMFAGFTSAYVVKSAQPNWLEFKIPPAFWYSTGVILLSSLTIQIALKAFKAREMARYRTAITITALLGVAFIVLQWIGFQWLEERGVKLLGIGSNAAASFIGVITGVHMAHVLGGVIAILFIFFRAYSSRSKVYSSMPVELVSIYWHFVDGLWIYLFVFYHYMSS